MCYGEVARNHQAYRNGICPPLIIIRIEEDTMNRAVRVDGPLRRLGRLVIFAVGLIIIVYCGMAAFSFGQKLFAPITVEESPGTDKEVEVEAGTSIKQLGELLQEFGIIEDSNVFYVQSIIFEVKTVKPGTYIFNTSQTGEEILSVVRNGPKEDQENPEEAE